MKPLAAVCLVLLLTVPAWAGGPMLVGSPVYGISGQPFRWDNSKPIQYHVDGGPLGSSTNAAAIAMVDNAFRTWAQIPGVAITPQNMGGIQGVADGDVSTTAEFDTVMNTCDSGQQSPVILDNGTLIQQLTGDSHILGFSGPCNIDSATGTIRSAFSLLSAPPNMPLNYLTAEVIHELGHFLGLDHTETRKSFTGTTQADIDGTATMFFQLITPLMATPKPDDKAWMATLYPAANYNSLYGMIKGQVLFSDGVSPVQDVLVLARSIGDPHVTILSSITGYRFTSNPGQSITADYMPCVPATQCTGGTWGDNPGSITGSLDPALIGLYEIPAPPGQYQIEVHALGNDGNIGPFNPPLPMPGPEEYWNPNETDHDWDTSPGYILANANPGIVTVVAGQTVGGIDIILNGTAPTYDMFEGLTTSPSGEVKQRGGAQ